MNFECCKFIHYIYIIWFLLITWPIHAKLYTSNLNLGQRYNRPWYLSFSMGSLYAEFVMNMNLVSLSISGQCFAIGRRPSTALIATKKKKKKQKRKKEKKKQRIHANLEPNHQRRKAQNNLSKKLLSLLCSLA